MVTARINRFGGMVPSIDERLLPDTAATVSEDCFLYSGTLTPLPEPTLLRALTNSAATFAFRIPDNYTDLEHLAVATWMEFTDLDTCVIRAPVSDDDFDRYYWVSPSEQARYNTRQRISASVGGNDSFTKILLHFDGVDAATTTEDWNAGGSSHTWTAAGNAQIDTADSKFGGASSLHDGNGDLWTTPHHADFVLGAGAWTFDFQFKCTAVSGGGGNHKYICGDTDAGFTAAASAIGIRRSTTDKMTVSVSNGSAVTSIDSLANYTSVTNTGWHHARVTRSGNFLYFFIDGVIQNSGGTAFSGTVPTTANVFTIGGRVSGTTVESWQGWIDEIKLDVGIARSVANFTPPTLAYTTAHGDEYLLGVPQPATPGLIVTGGGGTTTTRSYVYTWVTHFGEEGPASSPVLLTGFVNGSWDLTFNAPSADDQDGPDRDIDTLRVYRTVTSASGVATYFFVAEQTVTDTTYSDTISDTVVSANDQLQSSNWVAPPSDLEGWVTMPNGMLAGWRGTELWFSVPFRPHAWPELYVLTTDYPIIGLGVTGQTLVVCTTGFPCTVTGINPNAMAMSKIATWEPCMSRGSIISAPEGVYYASPNGLVLVANGSATVITRQLIRKDRWQAASKIATLRAARLNLAYYAFGTTRPGVFETTAFETTAFAQEDFTGALNGIFMDTQDLAVAFTTLTSNQPMVNVFNDTWTGEVLFINNGGVYWLNVADTTPDFTVATWRSKVFSTPKPTNFGACQIFFDVPDNGPSLNPVRNTSQSQTLGVDQYAIARIIADGNVVHVQELRNSPELIRPPSGFKASDWQIELETQVVIVQVVMASSVKELARA